MPDGREILHRRRWGVGDRWVSVTRCRTFLKNLNGVRSLYTGELDDFKDNMKVDFILKVVTISL